MRMRPAQVLRPGNVLQYVVTAAVLKNATGKKYHRMEIFFHNNKTTTFLR